MEKIEAMRVLGLAEKSNKTVIVSEMGVVEHEQRKHFEALDTLFGSRARAVAEDNFKDRVFGQN